MKKGSRLGIAMCALVLLPGIASADYTADKIGQSQGISSMLLQPPVAYLSHDSDLVLFQTPFEASRLGISMGYNDPLTAVNFQHSYQVPGITTNQDLAVSATAVGEYSISSTVDLFGKIGFRYLTREDIQGQVLLDNLTRSPGFDRRFGFGVKVKASDVLSLHFEWERYAQSDTTPALPALGANWDPWRERNVFGAGVRLGF